jgi:hypothetical protein
MNQPWKAIWDKVEHIPEGERTDPDKPIRIVCFMDDDTDQTLHIELELPETDRLGNMLHRHYVEGLAAKHGPREPKQPESGRVIPFCSQSLDEGPQ